MLQGDAIREITLEGPGAGGVETASAVIADMVSVIGTMGTGFLQNDAAWRQLPKLPAGDSTSPFYFRLLGRRPAGRARARRGRARAARLSIARLLQLPNGNGASLHVVTHEGRAGSLDDALEALGAPTRGAPALTADAGDLRSRDRGARMGVTAYSLGEGSTPLVALAAAFDGDAATTCT